MEEVVGDNASPLTALANWRNDFSKAFQYYLDRSVPHITRRWLGTLAAAAVYFMRVFYVQGFYVVSYGLGIYILNLLTGFMSPKDDPELEALDGTSLPTKDSDEFRPFIRRLPEFKFWYAITKAFCVAFLMTFISVLNIPVYWPTLFFFWVFLFLLTMKQQITHMIKHRYIPFNIGKQIYAGKKSAESTKVHRKD
ncbi:protein RER1B-like [Olea europaea var. sylvestris]|uniref:Protein RER1 n=1 Tax=Olea europaea subsp. europaea TaxID=158383 RepID=A0A8S0QVA8_OLEEU|nr:protein RER1B-like [Olea europaea var. sylvestris]CAA2970029.1 RER1B-like [Olea europaea subsp. europaea]